MTTIHLTTELNADIETCFDTSRDISIHLLSTKQTNEKVISGRTSGLCELGDKITWEARHFGLKQQLTVEITKLDRPYFFEDVMLKGAFKSMRHEHHFETNGDKTVMMDKFYYEVPFGILGNIFNKLILERYMTNFIKTRNGVLKSIVDKKFPSEINGQTNQ
jgi:ligand-binding SRPBCC domain-containing protein